MEYTEAMQQWKELTPLKRHMWLRNTKLPTTFIEAIWEELKPLKRQVICRRQRLTADFVEKHWDELPGYEKTNCLRYSKVHTSTLENVWQDLNECQRYCAIWKQKLPPELLEREWCNLTDRQRMKCYSKQKLTTKTVTDAWQLPATYREALEILTYQPLPQEILEQEFDKLNIPLKVFCFLKQQLSPEFIRERFMELPIQQQRLIVIKKPKIFSGFSLQELPQFLASEVEEVRIAAQKQLEKLTRRSRN